MKILIIGGTVFLGRFLVEAAQARGHEVTLFNRGRHNPELFPGVEKLRGDRRTDLSALGGRRWDAVIDTSGYTPGTVGAVAELLAGAVGHYTFISSISVYAQFNSSGYDESAPVGTITDEEVEAAERLEQGEGVIAVSYGEKYGPLKARCEDVVRRTLPDRALVIRPGLIVGPHDYSDRFTYWPVRIARGGEVLAPGRPERPVRVIDVRDLAQWNIRLTEASTTGTFNASGADRLTMGQLLEECVSVSQSGAKLTWVDEQFLITQGVGAWAELPLWIPEEHNGIFAARNDRAISTGLTFRPLSETISDTLAWAQTRPAETVWRAGLKADREQELLRHWHETAAPVASN